LVIFAPQFFQMDNFKPTWVDTYTIHWSDTTPTGKAGIVAMMNFFQESAWHHADHLGFGLEKSTEKEQAWVITRLKFKMKKYPGWPDIIRVETWPSGREGLQAFRDFRIFNDSGEVIGCGTSTWMVISILTRRPKKLDFLDKLQTYEFPNPVFESQPGKIVLPPRMEQQYIYKVRFGDLDAHGHVNNVKYAAMVMEAFSLSWHTTHILKEFEINYLHEAMESDELSVKLSDSGNGDYFACVHRLSDNQQIFIAHLEWEKLA
jgi:medium-chain acyl-[acyl-carrier-protein] hydrolase